MIGDPGVEVSRQVSEPGSQEQPADRTPYQVTCPQHSRDGGVATGDLAVLTTPLHR